MVITAIKKLHRVSRTECEDAILYRVVRKTLSNNKATSEHLKEGSEQGDLDRALENSGDTSRDSW